MTITFKRYNPATNQGKPNEYGKYFTIRDAGVMEEIVWNNTGWSKYNDRITHWAARGKVVQ